MPVFKKGYVVVFFITFLAERHDTLIGYRTSCLRETLNTEYVSDFGKEGAANALLKRNKDSHGRMRIL